MIFRQLGSLMFSEPFLGFPRHRRSSQSQEIPLGLGGLPSQKLNTICLKPPPPS